MIFISILILIVAIALPTINKNLSAILYTRISSIIFIYAGALSLNALHIQSIGSGIGIYSGLFHVTLISQSLEVFLLIIGSIILLSWPLYINKNNFNRMKDISFLKNTVNLPKDEEEIFNLDENEVLDKTDCRTEYSLIVLFSTLGSSLLISSSDLISMYLSIELQSFGLYILATLYRDLESATSAGLKYFLIGGLSSCLILFGSGLLYSFTGLTNFESVYSLISVSDNNYIIQGLSLGLIFIIVGFLIKIASAPLHNWAPDVYDDSPTIVTIWLTIMPKLSILILLLELQTQIDIIGELSSSSFKLNLENLVNINLILGENTKYVLKNLLLISSLLSLIIGTVVGLSQTRVKRLLAYSTISHIGFILLALVINTEQSIDSLLFYIIQYTITNLNTFLILIALGYSIDYTTNKYNLLNNKVYNQLGKGELNKDIKFISELKSQFYSNPVLSLSLTVCLFSMAGVPPLIGFFSKQFVLYSAIQNGYNFMSVLAILASVISASYYLKIIRLLHTEVEEDSFNNNLMLNFLSKSEEVKWYKIKDSLVKNKNQFGGSYESYKALTNFHSFLISSLTLTIILFVFKPSIILNITQLLSLSIYNF